MTPKERSLEGLLAAGKGVLVKLIFKDVGDSSRRRSWFSLTSYPCPKGGGHTQDAVSSSQRGTTNNRLFCQRRRLLSSLNIVPDEAQVSCVEFWTVFGCFVVYGSRSEPRDL